VNALLIVFAVMILFNCLSVPYVKLFEADKPYAYFHLTLRYIPQHYISSAYMWTLYGSIALIAFAFVTGTFKRVGAWQDRPLAVPGEDRVRRWWWWTILLGVLAVAIMFVQAGFTVPALTVAGKTFAERQQLRLMFADRINQTLFSLDLFFVVSMNLIMAVVVLKKKRWFYLCGSAALLIVTALFALSKSHMAASLTVVVMFVALAQRVRWITLFRWGIVMLLCIIPWYYIQALSGGRSLTENLVTRIVYGQWVGMPHYVMLYEHDRAPLTSLLPPYIQRFLPSVDDSPARKLMIFIEPEGALSGTMGNFPSFYIGEAFAAAGVLGAILAPFIVGAQLWLLVHAFALLPKNLITTQLFSWMLFRFIIGLISGFSMFMVSSFTIALVAVVGVAMIWEAGRARTAAYA
jgi:hypothetical protein